MYITRSLVSHSRSNDTAANNTMEASQDEAFNEVEAGTGRDCCCGGGGGGFGGLLPLLLLAAAVAGGMITIMIGMRKRRRRRRGLVWTHPDEETADLDGLLEEAWRGKHAACFRATV